jgi:isopenicillin N synthase-like dioxygenase
MKKFKKVLFALFGLSTALFANEMGRIEKECIIEYDQINSSQDTIRRALHDHGIIAVKGVPGFQEVYKNYIQAARDFVALSDEEKATCTPPDYYSRGWSYGVEKFNGRLDTFKGSYYATIPEEVNGVENVWPENSSFKEAYWAMAELIFETGKQILPQVDLHYDSLTGMSRMLYYAPVNPDTNDGNPNWCAEHRDHSMFTGLCPATFVKNGEIVAKPNDCGLYVRGVPVSFPKDVLIFQVGEAAQLLTNGMITATDHHVKKAMGDYERFTFALFFSPDREVRINSTVTEYNDRYRPGMTYGEWSDASFNKYKTNNEKRA